MEIKEFDFNFQEFCKDCNWCCCDEFPYDLKISAYRKNRPCTNLKVKECSIYSKRPFDCRIFPLDLKKIDNKVVWIVWENCPALKELNINKFLRYIEEELPKHYLYQHILNHVKHDKLNLPEKYDKVKFRIIREVCWNKA